MHAGRVYAGCTGRGRAHRGSEPGSGGQGGHLCAGWRVAACIKFVQSSLGELQLLLRPARPCLKPDRISQAPVSAGWCHSKQDHQIILNIADMREEPGRLRTVANLKAVKVKFIKEAPNDSLHSGPRCREGSTGLCAALRGSREVGGGHCPG